MFGVHLAIWQLHQLHFCGFFIPRRFRSTRWYRRNCAYLLVIPMPTIADDECRINLFHNSVFIIFALVSIWSPLFSVSRCCFSVSSRPLCPSSPLWYPHARFLSHPFPFDTHSFSFTHSYIHSFVRFASFWYTLPCRGSILLTFLILNDCRYHWLFGGVHFLVCALLSPDVSNIRQQMTNTEWH